MIRSRILDFHGDPNWVNLCIENTMRYVRGAVTFSGAPGRKIVERIGKPGEIAIFVDEQDVRALKFATFLSSHLYEGEDSEEQRHADDVTQRIEALLKQANEARG